MGMSSCPGGHLFQICSSWHWYFLWFNEVRVQSHPSVGSKGPSSIGSTPGKIHSKTWHGGLLTHYNPPFWSCKPWPSSVSSCVSHRVHHPMALMGSDVIPSAKCTWSGRCPHPLHITWSLHPSSVDTPADVHGRSHNFPLIHPREVFLAGHWVTAHPLSPCGIFLPSFTSLGSWPAWGGAGTSVPCMADTYTQGNANLWHDKKKLVSVEDVWLSALVHHFLGGDICCNLMHHLTCLIFPPISNLSFSLKDISLH